MVHYFEFQCKGHFTNKTKSPWPLHLKHSHWWKKRSQSKYASHYTWVNNGVSECKMNVKSTYGFLHGIEWIMFHGHLDYFQNPPLGGRLHTKYDTPNAHNRWFILFYHGWGPTWIESQWNSMWLRVRSNMTSHYTRGSVTTLHNFGSVLGWPLNTFFWALTFHGRGSWLVCEVALRWLPKMMLLCLPRLCPASIHILPTSFLHG